MSIVTATKDAALNGLTVTQLSLHSGWPGVTGANEVTGGSPAYARKSVTLPASSGGSRVTTAAVTFDVPASTTVRYIGLWNGTAFVGAMCNGGATPKNFVAMPSTDAIGAAAHGYGNGQKVAFFNGTPPGGLTEGAIYYVRDTATDSFKVSVTNGGAAVDITAGSSFGCVVCGVAEDVFTSQGTQQVTTITIAIPD